MNTRNVTFIAICILALALGAGTFGIRAHGAEASAPAGPEGGTTPPTVILLSYATGLSQPVDITNSGATNDPRLFVVQQDGEIIIVEGGVVQQTPFLAIDDRVNSGGEQGLLGLAFDPDYETNGFFYVNYTHGPSGDTRIARFTAASWDDDTVNPGTELILMDLGQPYENHNGGDLAFGSDGYLYIALGDGGSGGDPQDRAQNLSTPLGKILRIDVESGPGDPPDCKGAASGNNYTIPSDNPHTDGPGGACDEVWASGLRNPWRISFDRGTGDLYLGDVGQNSYEEVDFQPAASTGGENYGWRCYEGDHAYNLTGCGPSTDYVFPATEYDHSLGSAVTGGFVYRGALYPEMDGNYFFADYGSGRLWSMYHDGSSWQTKFQGRYNGRNFSTFGEDLNGELYVADISSGVIYQIHYLPDAAFIPIIRKN